MKKSNIVLLSLATIILAAVVWSIGMRFYYQHKFNQRVAELKAQGFPVSLDDLEKAYVLPEGVPNAADIYLEAFANYQESTEEEEKFLPISGNYIVTENVLQYPAEVMTALESHLTRNKKTLELLDKAAKIECCLWPRRFDESFFSLDRFRPVKKALQLLLERNVYFAQQGKAEEAVRSFKTTIALSQSLLAQPFDTDYMVTLALEAMSVGNLSALLNEVRFTDTDLHELQAEFNRIQTTDDLRNAIINERCALIDGYGLPFTRMFLRVRLWDNFKTCRIFNACYSLSWLEIQDRFLMLGYYERVLQQALEPHEGREVMRAISKEIDQYSAVHLNLKSLHVYAKAINLGIRVLGNVRCAETALTIERHRLKYNTLPDTLEQLVPEFMAQVPRDPFDNEVLRYIRHDVGYTVYTIGEDGVDNGGLSQEQMEKENGQSDPEEYDWPFTVRR